MARRWLDIGRGRAKGLTQTVKDNPGKTGAGVFSLVALLSLVVLVFNAHIESYDVHCTADPSNPFFQEHFPDAVYGELCIVPIRVTIPNSTLDIYNSDQLKMEFSPEVEDSLLFIQDGRCKSTKTTPISGYCPIDFSQKRRSDAKYVFRFVEDKPYYFNLVVHSKDVLKVQEGIKWSMSKGLADGYLDPLLKSPFVKDATVRQGAVFFNFTQERAVCEEKECTLHNESYASLDMKVFRNNFHNPTNHSQDRWTPSNANVLVDETNDHYKVNVTSMNRSLRLMAFQFNASGKRYSQMGDTYIFWTDIEKAKGISINNTLLRESVINNSLQFTLIDGLPSVMFWTRGNFDPTVELTETQLINQSYLEGASSNGQYIHLNSSEPNLELLVEFDVDTGALWYSHDDNQLVGTVSNPIFESNCPYDNCLRVNTDNNSYVKFDLPINLSDHVTIALWANITNAGTLDTSFEIANSQSGSDNIKVFLSQSGNLWVVSENGGTNLGNQGWSAGQWFPIVLTFNSTQLNSYTLTANDTTTKSLNGIDNPEVWIGKDQSAATVVNASYDRFMIFDEVKSDEWINQYLNGNLNDTYNANGLVTPFLHVLNASANETGHDTLNVSLAYYERNLDSNISLQPKTWKSGQGYTCSNNPKVMRCYTYDNIVGSTLVDEEGAGNATIVLADSSAEPGYLNQSMRFNNSNNEYASFSGGLRQNGGFSTIFRFEPGGGSFQTLFSTQQGASNIWLARASGDGFNLNINNPTSYNVLTGYVMENTTYHLAMSWEQNRTILCLSGVGCETVDTVSWNGTTSTVYIGDLLGAVRTINGVMDQTVFYNQTLTENELWEIVNNEHLNWNYSTSTNITDYNSTHSLDSFSKDEEAEVIGVDINLSSQGFYTPILTSYAELEVYTAEEGGAGPDTTNPTVELVLNDSSIPQGGSIAGLISADDDTGVVSVNASISLPNGSVENVTASFISGNTWQANYDVSHAHPTGTYTMTVIAGDAAGNINDSESTSFNVTAMTVTNNPVYSSLQEQPADSPTWTADEDYNMRVTWGIDTPQVLDTIGIQFDGVNYTQEASGNGTYNFQFSNLSAGVYTYYHWANTTTGEENRTPDQTYTITPASCTPVLTVNGDSSSSQSTLYADGILLAVDVSSCDNPPWTVYQNGTNISSQVGTSFNLSSGAYNMTVISNASGNYSRGETTILLYVNKSVPGLSISLNTSSTVSLGTTVQVTGSGCPQGDACSIYRNDTGAVSNPYSNTYSTEQSLHFNYTMNETQNYTAHTVTQSLNVINGSAATTTPTQEYFDLVFQQSHNGRYVFILGFETNYTNSSGSTAQTPLIGGTPNSQFGVVNADNALSIGDIASQSYHYDLVKWQLGNLWVLEYPYQRTYGYYFILNTTGVAGEYTSHSINLTEAMNNLIGRTAYSQQEIDPNSLILSSSGLYGGIRNQSVDFRVEAYNTTG